MNKIYSNLADGLEKVAAGYRALAEDGTGKDQDTKAQKEEESSIDIETLRALLAEKSRDGKTKEIKALLMKYDAGKLSGVKPEDYLNLFAEAEAL